MLRIGDLAPGDLTETVEMIDGETRVTTRRMVWRSASVDAAVRADGNRLGYPDARRRIGAL